MCAAAQGGVKARWVHKGLARPERRGLATAAASARLCAAQRMHGGPRGPAPCARTDRVEAPVMKRTIASIAFGLAAGLAATAASAQATLNNVKQKGFLACGSNPALPGFGIPDAQGNWTGFDVDYCRAFAAAIFNDPTKVRFIPLSAKDRFTALQSGEIDVLVRNSTWTMSRDTQLGLDFPAVNYYDGQGFMVRKKLGVSSAKELNGASVCTQQGTT